MATDFPRILLVSAKAKGFSIGGINLAPPIGLYQLKHYANQRGVSCALLDRELYDIEEQLTLVEAGAYDVIGFSVTRANMLDDLEVMWSFKQAAQRSGRRVIFIGGGQEATQNHEQWLDFGLEAILIGYAEKILVEFARRLRNWGDIESADISSLYADMAGITFRRADGSCVYNPAPMLTPAEFREFFYEQRKTLSVPFDRYWGRVREGISDYSVGGAAFVIENVRIYSSSHCPRGCGFCNSQSFLPIAFGSFSPIILLSADELLELIVLHVKRDGARSFLFSDDDFPVGNQAGLNRMRDFCTGIIKLKEAGEIPKNVRFSCQARVMDFVLRADSQGRRRPNVDMIHLMARAGFLSIGLGVETFVDRILRVPSVSKVAVSSRDCQEVIDAILAAGMTAQTNLMLGIPEYTAEELSENIEIAIKYVTRGCDVAVTTHMLTVPGAPIWNKGLYAIHYNTWINPMTGGQAEIPEYYIANDPRVAEAMMQFGNATQAELDRVVTAKGWQGKVIHKRVYGICAMTGVAASLGFHEQAARFRHILDSLLEEPRVNTAAAD